MIINRSLECSQKNRMYEWWLGMAPSGFGCVWNHPVPLPVSWAYPSHISTLVSGYNFSYTPTRQGERVTAGKKWPSHITLTWATTGYKQQHVVIICKQHHETRVLEAGWQRDLGVDLHLRERITGREMYMSEECRDENMRDAGSGHDSRDAGPQEGKGRRDLRGPYWQHRGVKPKVIVSIVVFDRSWLGKLLSLHT
jgi:hypothetical protein